MQPVFAHELIETPKGPAARTVQNLSGDYRQFLEFGDLRAELRPLYTTADDPSFHVVGPGGPLAGVGDVLITTSVGTFRCTGALLPTGQHVLTAAHCITNSAGTLDAISGTVMFDANPGLDTPIPITTFTKHPAWDGDLFRGNDIAILTLSSIAPPNVPRYDIDRNGADDLSVIVNKAGYGKSGTGLTGATLSSGIKREGDNRYDALADLMLSALGLIPGTNFVPGSVLQYDFDNGFAQNDAFDFFFGINHLGFGADEVSSAPGDSGGPSFSNNVITGVTSYGITLEFGDGSTSDVNAILDSSFGEFSGDTRVSSYASFVDSVVPQVFCGRPIGSFSAVITGTSGNDRISGTPGDDLIDAKEGNDSIKGNGGNDCLFGGLGNDKISGGLGDDEVHGGPGIDHITGRDGSDKIFGEEDDDALSGGQNNDTIDGGPGNDRVLGREGDDTMTGGADFDSCYGESGVDTADVSCEVAVP